MLPSAVGREGGRAGGTEGEREANAGVEERERVWKPRDVEKKVKGRARRQRNYKD